MLRRVAPVLLWCTTAPLLQGWGSNTSLSSTSLSSHSESAWGAPVSHTENDVSNGGWGRASSRSSSSSKNDTGGGWGQPCSSAVESNSRWGTDRDEQGFRGGRRAGGWKDDHGSGYRKQGDYVASASFSRSGGFGRAGYGGADKSRRDGGWGSSSSHSSSHNRHSGASSFSAGWGERTESEQSPDAWNAAPPSFAPPIRRVDPLTLTAVEVNVDGVTKLVGQRVLISGLSDEATWHSLKDHLRQVAEVTYCRVYSHGRAMVEFSTPEDAARAITDLQASELHGATIFLREDREDVVLINTRRRIRQVREAQLRARKEEAERQRRELAVAQGDRSEHLESEPKSRSSDTVPSGKHPLVASVLEASLTSDILPSSSDDTNSSDYGNRSSVNE